ncbi:MAG: 4Fe-4S binding protein [Promethearchaeota archaeon]
MHETLGVEQDLWDPQIWRISPIWLSLCNRCLKCVEVCPEEAITVSW